MSMVSCRVMFHLIRTRGMAGTIDPNVRPGLHLLRFWVMHKKVTMQIMEKSETPIPSKRFIHAMEFAFPNQSAVKTASSTRPKMMHIQALTAVRS